MSIFNNVKHAMWFCRLFPPAWWISMFALTFVEESDGKLVTVSAIVLGGTLMALYFLFLLGYLPTLIFGEDYHPTFFPFFKPFWYSIFAGGTLGLGPVLWYWIKVDPILRQMGDESGA